MTVDVPEHDANAVSVRHVVGIMNDSVANKHLRVRVRVSLEKHIADPLFDGLSKCQ